MPSNNEDKTVIYNGPNRIKRGKIVVGTAVTNVSGVATFYWTDDGTSTGLSLLNTMYTYSADVEAGVQVNSRTSATVTNGIQVTVTNLQFTGITLLGINVLGAVNVTAVAGVTVRFVVFGD